MSERNFNQLLEAQWTRGNLVCVGLDSELDKIPLFVREKAISSSDAIAAFNRAIVNATKDVVCAYKSNMAFYESCGTSGLNALLKTIFYIREAAPDVPVILDAKRADIGNTNNGYAVAAFDYFKADAITVHPYLGQEALEPFLKRANKGIIVLCRTSNKGAGEFQDLPVPILVRPPVQGGDASRDFTSSTIPLYQRVAYNVACKWNNNGNCAVVVGATYPDELAEVREIVGNMPILIPGIGAQGGDLEKTVKAGRDNRGRGMIINSSRGIIFASAGEDFAEAARRETIKLHEAIKTALN
ncbi:MAG: orotidine-5'-phosphate decarboxylase [bacterium]|nr:orotidine-5'-phosphate decarboxylase [bacterium]